MDYATLQSRVRARLNMGTNDPAAANVDEYVNEAIHYLEAASPEGWPWMRRTVTLTTTASDGEYPFGTLSTQSTIAKVLSVKALNGSTYERVELLSPEEALDSFPSTTTGFPEGWFVEGQTLYLYPTPDTAYTIPIRVVMAEGDLSVSTQAPTMPAVFHSGIVEAALLLFYETLQDTTRVQLAESRVASWVARMRTYGREFPSAPKIRVRNPL